MRHVSRCVEPDIGEKNHNGDDGDDLYYVPIDRQTRRQTDRQTDKQIRLESETSKARAMSEFIWADEWADGQTVLLNVLLTSILFVTCFYLLLAMWPSADLKEELASTCIQSMSYY